MGVGFPLNNMKLWIYDNILSRDDYFALMDEFRGEYNPWMFYKKEHWSYKCDGTKIKDRMGHVPYPKWGAIHKPTEDELGDNLCLINIGENLKYAVQKQVKHPVYLERINSNIQFPGQEGTFHFDGDEHMYTMIVMVAQGWESQWGGDFICVGENDEHYITPYRPNRGILFQANYKHRGSAPNNFAWLERKTIAFTYRDTAFFRSKKKSRGKK